MCLPGIKGLYARELGRPDCSVPFFAACPPSCVVCCEFSVWSEGNITVEAPGLNVVADLQKGWDP